MAVQPPLPHHMLVLIHGDVAIAGEDHLSQVPLTVLDVNLLILKADLSKRSGNQWCFSVDWEAEKVVEQVCRYPSSLSFAA